MNWADWTFRCSDGTEYAIDAEGNVLLPEGRRITKGESFTVGPRDEPNIVRIPDGVALNPARWPHYAAADFVRLRVEIPDWHKGDRALVIGELPNVPNVWDSPWSRYSVEDDEVKVEHIDPRTVYFEEPNNPRNTNADPPPPYAAYRDPQTRLTRVAVAVKIALDGSVN